MDKTERMPDATPRLRPRYATRYEVAAIGPAGERVVVGYTARKSRHGLLATMQARGEELLALCGTDDVMVRRAPLHALIGAWRIQFTGRTERDAYLGQQTYKGATHHGQDR